MKQQRILDYYAACNAGDVAALENMFTEDVVHFFLAPNLAPALVAGRRHLARYRGKVQARFDGCWVVDNVLAPAEGDEAVIEWTLFWASSENGQRIATRGAEWGLLPGWLGVEPHGDTFQTRAGGRIANQHRGVVAGHGPIGMVGQLAHGVVAFQHGADV